MSEKTKLSNAELDVVKEKMLNLIIEALNNNGEDCGLATSYGKKTLCANLPYAEKGVEGVFEISIINKADMDYEDLIAEREHLTQVRKERIERAEEKERIKQKKIAESQRKREEKERARAEKEGA